jgi:DNA replication protein DnaC
LQAKQPIQKLTNPSDKCPHNECDGSGWIWFKDWSKRVKDNKEKDEWMESCKCYKEIEMKKKFHFAKIPEKFQGMTLRDFNINVYLTSEGKELGGLAKKAALNYIKHFSVFKQEGKGLFLYSEVKGSGKTLLLSCLANELVITHEVELIFIKADNLLSELKAAFGDNQRVMYLTKKFRDVEVLMIDDLGVEAGNDKASDWIERTFTGIIDERLEKKKVTFISSNYLIDKLDDVYKGGRLSSRIHELTTEVFMPEEKIRNRKASYENQKLENLLYS